MDGNCADAIEVLKLVVQMLPNTLIKIKKYANLPEQLIFEVDYLLSSTCYCGLPRLNQAANSLLSYLKSTNSCTNKRDYENLLEEIDNVLIFYKTIKPSLTNISNLGLTMAVKRIKIQFNQAKRIIVNCLTLLPLKIGLHLYLINREYDFSINLFS